MGSIIRIFFSLITIFIAAYCIEDYPYGKLPILLTALLYGGVLYGNRRAWLFVIPVLIPVSDLTLYSGRLFLSELDIIFLVTLAILILPKRSSQNTKTFAFKVRLPDIAIGLMAISYIIGTAINLSYPTGADANNFSSYQSPMNTFRVAKGFFWALVFWPFLRNQYATNPKKTKSYLITGILGGLFLAGIAILWERGVIDDVFHWKGIYQIITDLLDFSSTYRVTGLFSSMHVGGTAIDGYLIMVIPFCLYGFLSTKKISFQLGSLACLMLGSYAIMVTFSRGLYGGFFTTILFLIFVLSYRYQASDPGRLKKLSGLILSFLFLTLYIGFLFGHGGYGATVGGVFLVSATIFAMPLMQKLTKGPSWIIFAGIILLGSIIIFDSLYESKWSDNGLVFSATSAIATSLILTGVTFFVNKSFLLEKFSFKAEYKKAILFSLVAGIFWVGILPPLLNVRVNERFSTSESDLDHRIQNWRNTMNFRENGIMHKFFGTGIGSFPRYYFFNNYNKKPMVNYRYGTEDETNFLSLGNGDFNITQKIPAYRPNQKYLLRFSTRTKHIKYSVSLKMCPKHIIYSDRYTPNCITKTIHATGDNEWQKHEIPFNSGTIGDSGIFNWPVTLLINNNTKNTITDITDIQLLDKRGINLITNGDFNNKNDRWIMIRDFSHDAWHAKNIFVHIIFEQGYFGLLTFLFLIFVALYSQLKAMKRNDPLAPILIAAITGTLIVGMFGTIIDNPRVTTLYFLLIFFSLLNAPQRKRKKRQVKNGQHHIQ